MIELSTGRGSRRVPDQVKSDTAIENNEVHGASIDGVRGQDTADMAKLGIQQQTKVDHLAFRSQP